MLIGKRKYPYLFIAFAYLVLNSAIYGQYERCPEDQAFTFAEVNFSAKDEMSATVREFREKLLENPGSKGVVYVFAGAKSRINEVDGHVRHIDELLGLGNAYDARARIWDGGFRKTSSAVFIFKPKECSDYSTPLADFTAEKVEFEEFSTETTIELSTNELANLLNVPFDPECPAAARAIRACTDGTEAEVFILIDLNGKVQFSQAISGHVMVRPSAAAWAKRASFNPAVKNGKNYNVSGIFRFRFKKGPKILANE